MRVNKLKKLTLFDYVNTIVMLLFSITILYPFVNTLAKSFSSETYITTGQVFLLPKGFSFASYKNVMFSPSFVYALRNTVFIAVVGTILSLLVVLCAAYAFSRKIVGGRPLFVFMLITMFFNGGMIPTFLQIKSLGLVDNIWALILPSLFSVYNMILARNFFQDLPDAVIESGMMDGCSELSLFYRIVLPMSTPIIATLALFQLVAFWNTFMQAILYINDVKLYPLQVYIRNVVFGAQLSLDKEAMEAVADYQEQGLENIKATVLMVSTIPIVCVYPFIQKYFVKGINMGAVKG